MSFDLVGGDAVYVQTDDLLDVGKLLNFAKALGQRIEEWGEKGGRMADIRAQ